MLQRDYRKRITKPRRKHNALENEDAFIELLKQVDAIDAGLVKWNNRLNFIFYVKKAGDVGNKLIGKLKKLFPDYEFKLTENEDKAWETYFGTLYPDKYAMQEIQNNKVLQTLQELP